MRIQTQVMAQAMREESHARARRKNGRRLALQDAQLAQAGDGDLVSVRVHAVPAHARFQERQTGGLHAEHEIVGGARFGRKTARGRKGAGDIGGVAAEFGASVEEDEGVGAGIEGGVVAAVVQCCGVAAAGHDGCVGLVWSSGGKAAGEEDGVEGLFGGGVVRGVESGGVGGGGDGVGVSDESDFVGVFADSAVVDGGLESGERADVGG